MAEVSSEPIRLPIVQTVTDLRRQVGLWRAQGLKTGFVPTMGALHDGHLSPVRVAQSHADRVVVSIFVNPKQFGPEEDFGAYPRPAEHDVQVLTEAGVDLLYMPSLSEMYPDGFATNVNISGVTEGLCGGSRPGHFDGVSTVVAKLLNQCQADIASFGEKDFQQLRTIERLVTDLDIPTDIIGAPTVRDENGLALSSRNVYLSESGFKSALALPRALREVATKLQTSETIDIEAALACGIEAMIAAGFDSVDYFELRDSVTLEPVTERRGTARLLTAANIGKTRLIDNIEVDFPNG